MTETTPILNLPLIHAAQAQKHLTHNDSINMLDALVQLAVIDDALSAPPSNPVLGERYIVANGGSAEWTGADGQIAVYEGGGWRLYAPGIGWVAYVERRGGLVNYTATGWAPVTTAAGLPEMVSHWGINTSADATNRLAVAANNTLFTHEGNSHRMKINKATTNDTASLMFQTNWAGRAEMGLAGEDSFSIKVKPDGLEWTTALRVDSASGALRAPSGGVRETALAALQFHVDASAGNDTQSGTVSAPLATIQEALNRIGALDAVNQIAEILLADGTHFLTAPVIWPRAVPGLGGIILQSASGNAANVTLDLGGHNLSLEDGRIEIANLGLTGLATTRSAITVKAGCVATLTNVVFDAPGQACIEADGGRVRLHGLTLTGSTARLLHARAQGVIDASDASIALDATASFSVAALVAELGGIIDMAGSSVTQAGTGKAYEVSGNAVLNAAGAALPGDAAGSTAAGGVVT